MNSVLIPRVLTIMFSLFSAHLIAAGLSMGMGQGDENITAFRAGRLWDWNKNWALSEKWGLTGFWEGSFSYWEREKGKKKGNDPIMLVAIAPVFVLRYKGEYFDPYFQAGIGASWLSQTEMGHKELSTHFQFEDRVGFGLRLHSPSPWDFCFNFFHFSNGSIERPNNGVNLWVLNALYHFQ